MTGYAITATGGWRMVEQPSDCEAGETYSVTSPSEKPNEWSIWNGSVWIDDISLARDIAITIIDSQAGRARAKYVTSVPGQDMTYILKAQQADAFKANGYAGAVPAFVQAKADANGLRPQQAADLIISTRDQWVMLGSAIEREREKGKAAVSAALSVADVLAAQAGAVAALQMI